MAIKNNDIDLALKGKKEDELDLILHGRTSLSNTMSVSLRGTISLSNDIDAVLKGKIPDELDLILHVKPQDEITCIIPGIDPPDIFAVYHFSVIEDFRITSGRLVNEVSIKYNYDYEEGKFKSAITKQNPLSKLLYREAGESHELKMIQETRQAERIADAILMTSSIPETICSFSHNLRSLYVEVGDVVSLTHAAGLEDGGYADALATVSKKNISGPIINYEIIMNTVNNLYRSELVNLSHTATAGAPGITVKYERGVATITIYADVKGYPPVQGAEITISGTKKITDQNGQARFNLDPGTYTAIITASGYENAEVTFTV